MAAGLKICITPIRNSVVDCGWNLSLMFSAKLCGWGGYLNSTQAIATFPEVRDCRDELSRQAIITPLQPDRRQGDPMRTRRVLVLVLLAVAGVSAQTFRGTILGTITDPSGAVV